MVLYVKAANNDKSVIQIAWYMLSVELGQKLADDDGNRLPTPVPNWPSYAKDGHIYAVRSTTNTIFVGIGVDVEALARTLADLCMRLQAPDHFCKPMPIVGIVTTVFAKPTQSSTEVNPGREVGRGIYTSPPTNAKNFYTWVIRKINELPYDDPHRPNPPKDQVSLIDTLGSIVWDVDDVFTYEHGSMPIVFNISDFRAIAEGRLKTFYDAQESKKEPSNTIVIIQGIDEPGILTLFKTNNAMISNIKCTHELPRQDFKDSRNADRQKCVCGICGCDLFGYAYRFKPDVRWLCIRCLANACSPGTSKQPSRKRLSAVTRDAYVNSHPFGHIVNDVKDDITRHDIAGVRMYFGKKNAYISSPDPVMWGGPALYDDPRLGYRTIYVADIYPD